MAIKDYYLILGVPRSASGRSIRAAFRARAKELHPDQAGPGSTDAFRAVLEAYEVLSDPVRRREYHSSLARDEEQRSAPAHAPRPAASGSFAEALVSAMADLAGASPALEIEVVLTPAEARRGAVVPLRIPRLRTCPSCGGAGGWLRVCRRCHGRGLLRTEEGFGVPLPAGLRSGTVLDVALDAAGLHDRFLRIHVRVSA